VIVVDSSVWIDHFAGRLTTQVAHLRAVLADPEQLVVVGDMYEVLCGLRTGRAALEVRELLSSHQLVAMLGFDLVYRAVASYRSLRARGVTIKAADVFIGTYCLETGMPLLTSDKDFAAMHDHLGLRRAADDPA
jgi:predicted nucleic acid-binding protein